MAPIDPLACSALAWSCDPSALGFETTDQLAPLDGPIGQDRAVEAVRYALHNRHPGYNVFALGPQGIGRHTTVRLLLEREAAGRPPPSDWCHVASFREPRRPALLRLPAGRGRELREDVDRLLGEIAAALRNAFSTDEYRTRRQVIEEELKERQEQAVAGVEEEARARRITLIRAPMGFAFAPLGEGGRVLTPEQFQELPEEERHRLEGELERLKGLLRDALAQLPAWMSETRARLRRLNEETATFAVGFLFETLEKRYAGLDDVLAFLEAARGDVIEHVEAFLELPETAAAPAARLENGPPLFRRYRVNLLQDNEGLASAPVVHEDDPTHERLFGRIEHRVEMGALVTDFLMIRGGALHRANGGYLVLDAGKLLARPWAWEGLKRALQARQIRIETPFQALGAPSTVALEPEPVPLDVKIVLVGERQLYYLLAQLDPEFGRLFKIAADFDERLDRDLASCTLHARLVATLQQREGLRPFDSGAVARVLEQSSRHAGDAFRLSADVEDMADLLREADYQATREARAVVGAADVRRAVDARIHRLDRVRERLQEQVVEGTVAIATSGSAVGQINGLSVLQTGSFAFGRPSRITARVRVGAGEVLDIEREVKLGGPLHSKGLMIMSSFLAAHLSPRTPLSLAASLVFEQSYGGVDGDSASAAELFALVSAIAEVPLSQAVAVTGSINQMGEIQAIGGVNEKIEGFFDLCATRGLDGSHGVVIPRTNQRHLMLHERVREAVAQGLFRIWAIGTVAEGIEILTGLPAGAADPDGEFPEGSVFGRAKERLRALAEVRRSFSAKEGPSNPPGGEERS